MKGFKKFAKKKWVAYSLATCSAVLLYVILSHMDGIFSAVGSFFAFLKPVLLGMIIAYIFNPLANFFDRKVFGGIKNEKTRWKISVAVAIIVLVTLLVLLGVALIPQLAESVTYLASNMGDYLNTLQQLIQNFEIGKSGKLFGLDFSGLANITETLVGKLSSYFTDNMETFVVTSANIGKNVFDFVLALILAIYFLLDKRRIVAGVSEFFALLIKQDRFEKIGTFLERCNLIIIRYISYDIIDGVIVGIVNFLFMIIMGMPYSVLISVIVGATNLAPTFGPIVGAVIGGFILVLVNPWNALWFIIFTLILQTVDGYVLKPRLFGGSLGVSPLMILISIILGGRLFGVPGILIAIPFAAIFDFTWKDFVIKKLEEKKKQRYNI